MIRAALLALLLSACTTPPQPTTFERCMTAMGGSAIGLSMDERLKAATFCREGERP